MTASTGRPPDSVRSRLRQASAARIRSNRSPLPDRHRHEVGLDAAADELLGQPPDVTLGAPVHERRLHREDQDAARSQGAAETRAISA